MKRTGAVSCSTRRAAIRCASSSFAVTVDMKGGAGFCQVAFASAGLRRSAARATSGLWNAPLTRSFTVFRAPRAAAASIRRSTAAFSPETTIWPGQL